MKKNTMLVLGIILALILIGFFTIKYLNNQSINNLTLQEKIEACSKSYQDTSGIWYRNITCISSLAVEYKDEELCKYTGYRDATEHCTADVFIAKGNITECGRLRDYDDYCTEQILNKTNSS